jgi:hypothetical protein
MDSRRATWIKALLLIFAVSFLLNGAAMLFTPDFWFFRLIAQAHETGPFNSHLVRDIGTFYLPIGFGLLFSVRDPVRHAPVVAVAGAASVLHALMHVYSHFAGWLSSEYLGSEIVLVYIPSVLLAVLAIILIRKPDDAEPGSVRAHLSEIA